MNEKMGNEIKISTFADLVCGKKPSITYIPLRELYAFKNHPFKVLDDEKMMELSESIKSDGVLVPGIVRPRNGEEGYEIIAGHRRKRACEIAGLLTMPVVIKNLDDDQAVIEMVNSNIQREQALPSEKAFAFKMKLEAMSHQGKSCEEKLEDTTSRQVVTKLRSDDEIGKTIGESGRQIQRYIRLTELITPLLDMVDSKKIKFVPAVELSYLTDSQQEILLNIMNEEAVVPSLSQAQQLKRLSQEMSYTKESVLAIMVVAPSKERKITIKQEVIYKYFDPEVSDEEIENVILGLLDEWKKKGGSL